MTHRSLQAALDVTEDENAREARSATLGHCALIDDAFASGPLAMLSHPVNWR